MTSPQAEPLPCPFCGGKAQCGEPNTETYSAADNCYVFCEYEGDACCARGPEKRTREEAIDEWNRVASLRAQVERAREEIERLNVVRSKRVEIHRRMQSAEAGLRRAMDPRYEAGERTFGRALANSAAGMYHDKLLEAEARSAEWERLAATMAALLVDERELLFPSNPHDNWKIEVRAALARFAALEAQPDADERGSGT